MGKKNFHYTEIDGEHFPDATLGSNLFYGIDFSCWLDNEDDEIVSAEWTVPDGVSSDMDFRQDNIGNVKLEPLRTGSFTINCILTSEETLNGVTLQQEKSIDIILKVF